MQATVYEKYGPPEALQLRDVQKPTPKADEVLDKIHATSITKYDCWMRNCTAPPGFGLLMRIGSGRKPNRPLLGTELAREIDAVGYGVSRLKVGDQACGYPGMNMGVYAEYIEQVAAAHRYAESGQKMGNVVIAFDQDNGYTACVRGDR